MFSMDVIVNLLRHSLVKIRLDEKLRYPLAMLTGIERIIGGYLYETELQRRPL